jgi:6-phosphogluconolactonase
MGPNLVTYYDADHFYEHLAEEAASRLRHGVEARGGASLACAGGSTPGPLYDRLSRYPLPWAKVEVTLTDERWVAPSSTDSNQAMLSRRLLQGPAAQARFVPLKTDDPTPRVAQAAVDGAVKAMRRPFDVVILGMGADGHIASLFPKAEGVKHALDPRERSCVCAAVAPPGAAGAARISLTLSALLDSRLIILAIQGEDKRRVYEHALEPGDPVELPVRAVLQQNAVPVFVYWLR